MPTCNILDCSKEATDSWYNGQFMVYACKAHTKQYKHKGEIPLAVDVLIGRNTDYWKSLHG